MKNMKLRLIVMNFLEYAVWGAYLTSMGRYLAEHGLGSNIGIFYSIQGIVSLFMPALMGIVADRWIPAQKLLSICHALAGAFMVSAQFFRNKPHANRNIVNTFINEGGKCSVMLVRVWKTIQNCNNRPRGVVVQMEWAQLNRVTSGNLYPWVSGWEMAKGKHQDDLGSLTTRDSWCRQ